LRNIDAKAVIQLTGDSTVRESIALLRGEIAARRGNYAAAQQDAVEAARVFDRANADLLQRQALARLRKNIEAHLRATR
jgi:hypothetical protein